MPDTLFRPVHREIGNILKDVMEGRVGLPDLQRPFVWKNDKVRDLLDSMIKGYPIGYVMLWESPEDYTEKKTAIGDNSKSFEAPKELVIDGQQRLTALVSALFGVMVKDKDFNDRTIKIAYNPIMREFANWDASIQRNASFIPDISSAFAAKRSNSLSAFRREYINGLNESNKKKGLPETTEADEDNIEQGINDLLFLEQYQLPTLEILNTADEEMVSDIFVRVNSQGQSLKQDDFIMTLLSVYEPGMRMRIESFCKDSHAPAEGTSYNPLLCATATLIIRATIAVGFNRGRLRYAYSILRGRDLETKETSVKTREESFAKFGAALDKVLDINNWHAFINTLGEAGYINQSQISSENAVIFNYAFYLIGKYKFNLNAIQLKKLIKRWFFASSITSLYAGSFESMFEQELTAIKTLSNANEFISYFDGEINSLLTEDYFSITLPNALDANEAVGPTWNAFIAAQIIRGSKILFNTVPVSQLYSLGASGSKRAVDKHHLFPDNFLKEEGYEDSRSNRANFTSLDPQTNIFISDEDPAIYVAQYRKAKGEEEYLRNCKEHALPLDFENMDYMQFLDARRKLIAAFIKQAFLLL